MAFTRLKLFFVVSFFSFLFSFFHSSIRYIHSVCEADEERGQITMRNPRSDERDMPKVFTFDAVFGPDVTQRHIYDVCGAPLVESVLGLIECLYTCIYKYIYVYT